MPGPDRHSFATLTPFALALTLAVALSASLAPAAAAEESADAAGETSGVSWGRAGYVEEVVVRGRPLDNGLRADGAEIMPLSSDSASLVERIPGGAVNRNGPLSGDIQLGGLSGARVAVHVAGQRIDSGSPNRMDPPLHYAPRAWLEELVVTRGIASVDAGPESAAGTARARLARSVFRESERWELSSTGSLTSRSANHSFDGGTLIAASNDTFRVHLAGALEHADDLKTRLGQIEPTEYQRTAWGGGAGVRFGESGLGASRRSGRDLGQHELGFDLRRYDTRNAGTSALPMDIDFFDTTLFRADYRGRWRDLLVEAAFAMQRIDHEMDNFRLREPPPGLTTRRASQAASAATTSALTVSAPLVGGRLQLGGEIGAGTHEQDIADPDRAAFFVRNFAHVRRDHWSLFSQWNGPLPATDAVELELGVRYTRLRSAAGFVDATPARMLAPARRLRDRFNSRDRSRADNHLDWVVKLAWSPLHRLELQVGAARKTRSPSYVERYAWLPLEVTGGLADGNNYVGDADLEPEVFREFEAGFTWQGDAFYLSPRVFYRRAHDFISGVPASDPDVVRVSSRNGDATPLRFANLPAEFRGLDAAWGLRLRGGVRVDGIITWVRGRRRDIHDDLHRVSPLRARTRLSVGTDDWRVGVESVLSARQGHVSDTNGESPTGSYSSLNLFARWQPDGRPLRFEAGLENLFDRDVRDHLAGVKRTSDGAIPAGTKLPSGGRGVFGRFSWDF